MRLWIRIACVGLALVAAAGCGGGERTTDQGDSMTVRRLDPEDTTGLSEGRALLERLAEESADQRHALRVHRKLDAEGDVHEDRPSQNRRVLPLEQ